MNSYLRKVCVNSVRKIRIVFTAWWAKGRSKTSGGVSPGAADEKEASSSTRRGWVPRLLQESTTMTKTKTKTMRKTKRCIEIFKIRCLLSITERDDTPNRFVTDDDNKLDDDGVSVWSHINVDNEKGQVSY
ncbi:hypothetical protein BHM03_00051370 [Ensete ventricosum]|nr:hypothetical protein BHM03_00051370 [Ensete ventricosum]